MRKAIMKSKSICLTTSWSLILAGLVTNCASSKLGPYSAKETQANPYYQELIQSENTKLIAKASESPYQLLRATFNAFLEQAREYTESNAWLSTLPSGTIHGDFHVQQSTWRDLKLDLDDWDTVSDGPYWLDVLRAETSALLWSKALGFRQEYNYPCINAYTNALVRNEYTSPTKAFDQHIKPNTDKDQSTSTAWMDASELKDSEKVIHEAFVDFARTQDDIKLDENAQVRSLSSGVGSLLKSKLLYLDPSKQLWELKEVTSFPFKDYYNAELAHPNIKGCGRYKSLLEDKQAYALSRPHACFEHEGRVFTLLKWSHSYFSLKAEHIQNFSSLEEHTEWVCSSLARFHERSMDKAEKRKWGAILKSPAPFQTTFKRMTREIVHKHEEAYKMLLLKTAN